MLQAEMMEMQKNEVTVNDFISFIYQFIYKPWTLQHHKRPYFKPINGLIVTDTQPFLFLIVHLVNDDHKNDLSSAVHD